MADKDNTIFWVIGIVIFLFLILPNLQQQDKGLIGLTVHYYKDGVEVQPKSSFFSIVTPPGGSYDNISLSISGTATGISYSNIRIVGATPTAFLNALPTTIQTLGIGTKILWTSNLMSTSQFETMAQPVRFWINISATNDYNGLKEYKQGYKDLTIGPSLPSLVVTGTMTLNGNQKYSYVIVQPGATLITDSSLNLTATQSIEVYGTITADGKGNSGSGAAGGGGTNNDGVWLYAGGGGGAGYGSNGGSGGTGSDAGYRGGYSASGGGGGATYGNNLIDSLLLGSVGGVGGNMGAYYYDVAAPFGFGGGAIQLNAPKITINGVVTSDGYSGGAGSTPGNGAMGGGGAGSGGTIIVIGNDVNLTKATFTATGGNGGSGGVGSWGGSAGGGGGGAGGRIKIFYKNTFTSTSFTYIVAGGSGGAGAGYWTKPSGSGGGSGVYYVQKN